MDKRAPFGFFGIPKEADLSANHASAAPVEPTAGDYITDVLGGLGIPREQALKLGAAFGLLPELSRESGRALALPIAEPTAGNIAGAGAEAAMMALPFGLGKAARHVKNALIPSGDVAIARNLHWADPKGTAALPDLGFNRYFVHPAQQAGHRAAKIDKDDLPLLMQIANDRKLGVLK
jgi:hypothetical protein